MTRDSIFQQIHGFLTILKVQSDAINEDMVLIGKKGCLDSLSALQLIFLCEETYKIDLLENDIKLERLSTVGTLINAIIELI